jgi:hypothetical protein
MSFTDMGAVVIDIDEIDRTTEVPKTPQRQLPPISPPPLIRNAVATYKQRVGVHALRAAGFTLDRISSLMERPISTIGDIARNPTTPPRTGRSWAILDTPKRRTMINFLRADPQHRRFTLGELKHALGYTCSDTTLRRALAKENHFRYVAKSFPWLTQAHMLKRINYVDACLQEPDFHWQHCAWSDEGWIDLGGKKTIWITRQPGPERFTEACVVPRFKPRKLALYWIAFTARSNCPIIIWDRKNWGTMTSAAYLEHVVPVLRDWMRNEEIETGQPHYLVQDNAPSHVAKATLAQMKDEMDESSSCQP